MNGNTLPISHCSKRRERAAHRLSRQMMISLTGNTTVYFSAAWQLKRIEAAEFRCTEASAVDRPLTVLQRGAPTLAVAPV